MYNNKNLKASIFSRKSKSTVISSIQSDGNKPDGKQITYINGRGVCNDHDKDFSTIM
jgi:hypothetical protein